MHNKVWCCDSNDSVCKIVVNLSVSVNNCHGVLKVMLLSVSSFKCDYMSESLYSKPIPPNLLPSSKVRHRGPSGDDRPSDNYEIRARLSILRTTNPFFFKVYFLVHISLPFTNFEPRL